MTTPSLEKGRAAWLGSLPVSECEIGLTTAQTPLDRPSRPQRTHALAMRAARMGQLADTLERS